MYKLSKSAKRYIEEHYWDSFVIEEINDFVKESLERPGDAHFWDEELYVTHTLAFHTPDWDITDEYILGQSNYRAALTELEPYGATAATVRHWTYSRYQCIKVPMLTKKGKITAAALHLFALQGNMEDYPVLDEQLYSDLEQEVRERVFEATLADILHSWNDHEGLTLTPEQRSRVGEEWYYSGNAYEYEPGYIDEEDLIETLTQVLKDEVDLSHKKEEDND